jgi:hypothetical protein
LGFRAFLGFRSLLAVTFLRRRAAMSVPIGRLRTYRSGGFGSHH